MSLLDFETFLLKYFKHTDHLCAHLKPEKKVYIGMWLLSDSSDLLSILHSAIGPAADFGNGPRFYINGVNYSFDIWLECGCALPEKQKALLRMKYG